MSLVNELIKGLLPEQEKRTVAVYGGGFKPPTAGHFEVVKTALEQNPEIDELIILIGGKEREGVTPEESILIWDIYKQYLPMKVEIQLSSKPPIQAVYNYAKEHPEENVLFILGAREGNEDDFSDIAKRTGSIDDYPNLELRTIITQGGASGTAARNAAKISLEKFKPFLPKELKDEEVEEIYDMVKIVVTELGMKEKLGLRTTQSSLLKESKPFKKEGTTFKIGQVLTYRGYKEQRDFPVEVVDVKWNDERNEYEYTLRLLRDLSSQKKRGLLYKFLSAKEIKDRLADKQLTRAEFERQATRRKDSFDKPITYKRVGHFQENKPQDGKAAPYGSGYDEIDEGRKKKKDPKKGTGKKPKGSSRRLYTDEDPKDTIGIKFSTRQDIVDTLNKKSFKAKSHARQSQIINLIHQRTRAAYGRTKDPVKKKRLKTALDYITKKKEASKKKTQRLKKQKLNEVLDPVNFDFKPLIMSLTKSMEKDGLKLKPYPKVKFIHTDYANADDFFGKTAYYNPNNKEIVLYTLGRHPKDILRSYAHELIHVHQDNEDRLHDVQTTNINQDDYLEQLEREAYEEGNIGFRSWTNRITDQKDPFGLNAYALELAKLNEDENKHYIYLDMDGVVADFDKRFEDLSGMMPQEYVDKNGLNAFWDLIDEKHKVAFWRGIELMPGAEKLVNFVEQYPFEMLTAPSIKKQSVIGKGLWVKDKVGTLYSTKPKVTYRSAKQKHTVKPNLTKFDILIDDKASTIDRWNGAGGTAILYQSADQVINDLKKLGL